MDRRWLCRLQLAGLIGFLTCLLLPAVWAETKFIRLRNELIATEEVPPVRMRRQGIEPPVSGLYLVQFKGHVQSTWREQLESMGVHPIRFIPDDAFIVRLQNAQPGLLKSLPFVRWLGEYRKEHKIHGSLTTPIQSITNASSVRILLTPDASAMDVAALRDQLRDFRGVSRTRFGGILSGTVSSAQLPAIAQSPAVLWIEPAPRPHLYDEVATKIVAGESASDNHVPVVHELGFTGKGVTVAVADSGLDSGNTNSMHPDLAGRVGQLFFYGTLTDASDEHSHGTHVAGIVAGNAATGETDENGAYYGLGVAPGAHIVAQRIFDGAGNFEPPDSNEILTRDATRAGAVIGSNSWGDDTQGRYDLSAAEFDALVRDADAEKAGDQPYILEFSAGNAGPGAQTLGSPAVAKNVIATGASQNNRVDLFIYEDGPDAMADFSSRGPCEDGRIKPDVTAPGTWIASLQSSAATDEFAWMPISTRYQYQGGTSQAGPHASGVAAIFVQYYRDTHTNQTPSPALVKAALINSAVDMDDASGTAPAPNMDEGWGRLDLTEIIGSERRYDFLDQTVLLATDKTYERRMVVGRSDASLKITLAYTDVPGLPAAIPALVNDLDLEVIAPDGSLYRGNQFENGESIPNAPASDNVNNVEAVHLRNPPVGEYLIRVRARNVVEDARTDTPAIDQDFALVISGDLPLPGVGLITMDRAAYTIPSPILLKVVDYDLAGQASVSVLIKSSSQTNNLAIILTASGTNGIFTGRIDTAAMPVAADGRLHIAHGDVLEAYYQDTSPAGTRTASANADLIPPVITQVAATNQFGRILVTWQTDEPAKGLVRFGTNGAFAQSATNTGFTQSHQVVLDELPVNTTYQFYVVSTDPAGNSSTNNNQGKFYSFVVTPAATVLLVDAYTPDDYSDPIPVTTYTSALDQTGVNYEVWSVSQQGRSPTTNELRSYRIVIWRISDSIFSSDALDPQQQATLRAYLNSGGALFLPSMELLSRMPNSSFVTNVLQVQSFQEDVTVPSINGLENDPITAGMSIGLDYALYPYFEILDLGPDFSDTINPTTNAAPIFLDSASGKAAGLRCPRTGQDSKGRVVFLSFPFDTVPEAGDPPNNRANLLRNIINFLAPGVNGFGSVTLDSSAYTLPSQIAVELADSDLAGYNLYQLRIYSDFEPGGKTLTLYETARRGLFRGFITVAAETNAPSSALLRARSGDALWVEYFDDSNQSLVRATALVDTQPATIANVSVKPDYEDADISWDTSKPTDALVQFGESKFLGRTAYSAELGLRHELSLHGLVPDHAYFYQVVSRDAAGNVTLDDNKGQLYTFKTSKPIAPPWSDNLENGSTDWLVLDGDFTSTTWKLGPPQNGRETEAHSPTNAWGSNLDGAAIDAADAYLITPAIELTGGNKATLRFWHSYDFSALGDMDIYEFGQLHLTTNNGASWIQLSDYSESSVGWEEEEIDLTPYLGRVVFVAWYYAYFTLEASPRPGWLVDDVSITITNVPLGIIDITNNLAQAAFNVTGPAIASGQGWTLTISNAPLGEYVITYKPAPFYQTPPPQTNTLTATERLLFNGVYSLVDSNQNGIADAWEQEYFGALSPSHPAGMDSDGDGESDWAEFIAGTNPTNAASSFHFSHIAVQTNQTVKITWPATSGRVYRLEGSTNGTIWTPYTEWLRASGNSMSHVLPVWTNGAPFLFRLEVAP